jgi:phage-related protein
MQQEAATHIEIFCIDKVIKLNPWMLPNYSPAKLHNNYEALRDPGENSRTKTYTALVLGTKCMTVELHQTPKFKLSNKEFIWTQNTQFRVWQA